MEEELLSPPGPKKLSTEVQHIRLMHKIIGRKTGAISTTDPYFHKKFTPKEISSASKEAPDILDKICRPIVKFLIGKSKTTFPTRRKIYRFVASGDSARLLRYAKNTAIDPKTKRKAGIDRNRANVRAEIENDPNFWKAGKFNSQKFRDVLWARNEKDPLHSETVQELEKRLEKLSLKKGGKKKEQLSRLFKHEHENKTRINLTIDDLDSLDIEPPEDWQFVEVHLPAITFFESLNRVAEDVVWESLKEVEEIAKDQNDEFELREYPCDDCGSSQMVRNETGLKCNACGATTVTNAEATCLTVSEHKQLERLLLPLKWDPVTQKYPQVKQKGCFGSWNWPQKKTSTKEAKTPEEATRHNTRKLIYNIITILMEEDYIKFEGMTPDKYQQHFPTPNNSKGHLSRGLKAKVHAIHFTEKLTDLIGESEYRDFKKKKEHPIYRVLRGASDRWMYSPPQRHKMGKSPQAGGLLIEKDRSITNSSNRDYEKMNPPTPRCVANRGVLDAMNALQETQWEINLHLLQAFFDVRTDGMDKSLSDYPVREWVNQKQFRIKKITPKKIFKKLFDGDDDAELRDEDESEWDEDEEDKEDSEEDEEDSEEDEDEVIEYVEETKEDEEEMLGWVRKIISHNANVFWHSWELDFRGRLYPKCTRLSPHGNDLNRALIRFKHWKPLGKEKNDSRGIDWIHIHVHTFMEGIDVPKGDSLWKMCKLCREAGAGHGFAEHEDCNDHCGPAKKKQTFETRKKWVRDNLELLREMAKCPDEHKETLRLDRKRPGKDDVYQRLAALLELDRAHTEYERNGQDWSKVYSGHPIYLDATCNGYQHASTLLGNRELAELVNVVGKPGEEPRDLYAEVAKAAKEMSAVTPKQMTVAELRKLAKKHGVPRYSNLKQAELVDALYSARPLMKSAEKVRDYLDDYFLNVVQLNIAIDQIFDRSVAKKPTMTSAYGAKDLRKSFEGKGKEGKPLYWTAKKTQKEISDDQAKRDELEGDKKIKKIYRDYILRLEATTTPYSQRRILRDELNKMKKKCGLSKDKYKEYRRWILPTKTWSLWNDGSSLAVAILEKSELRGKLHPKENGFLINGQSGLRKSKTKTNKLGSYLGKEDALDPDVREVMDKRARCQHKLTRLVTKAYEDAINEVTKGALKHIQDALEKVADDGIPPNDAPKATKSKGDGLHPGVQWHLPQNDEGFRVNHYRIKKPNPAETRGGNPCRPKSVFNNRLPDWYTRKKYNGKKNGKEISRILQHLKALYGTNPEVIKAGNAKRKIRREIDDILEIVDPMKQDQTAQDIRRILQHRNISRYTYEDEEWRRIDRHKGRVKVEIKKLVKANKELMTESLRMMPQRPPNRKEKGLKDEDAKKEKKAKDAAKKKQAEELKPTADELEKITTSNHRLASSLLPNFIHSIDAYHMRKTIYQCDKEIDDLSFWAVHDAFGTHACDVDTMVGIVKRTFHDIHSNLDFEGWIGARSKGLKLEHIKDSEYIIN